MSFAEEDQIVVRLPDELARRVRRALREQKEQEERQDQQQQQQGQEQGEGGEQLDLELILGQGEEGREGRFIINGTHYGASLHDLPTCVESYKTYDGQNIVKSADVGQILLVSETEDPPPLKTSSRSDGDGGEPAPEINLSLKGMHKFENKDGITPPMRNARNRIFRPRNDVDGALLASVQEDLSAIMSGGMAQNTKVEVIEIEEEVEIDNSKKGN